MPTRGGGDSSSLHRRHGSHHGIYPPMDPLRSFALQLEEEVAAYQQTQPNVDPISGAPPEGRGVAPLSQILADLDRDRGDR